MPETFVRITWPGGQEETVYSPSSIIREYFEPATEMSLGEFEARCTQALDRASERVREVYGFSCSSAAAEKSRILSAVSSLRVDDADHQIVKILTINS